jgi:hypothetical protein
VTRDGLWVQKELQKAMTRKMELTTASLHTETLKKAVSPLTHTSKLHHYQIRYTANAVGHMGQNAR